MTEQGFAAVDFAGGHFRFPKVPDDRSFAPCEPGREKAAGSRDPA